MRSHDYIDLMNNLDPPEGLEKQILDAAEKAPALCDTCDGDQVSGTEIYSRSVRMSRLCALAAALAILIAAGGGVYGMMSRNARQVELSQITDESEEPTEAPTEAPTEIAPEEPTAPPDEAYPENSYDISTKDGIVAKLLNSVDFYERASGVCVQLPFTTGDAAEKVEFSYDTVTGEFRLNRDSLYLTNTYNDLAAGAFPEGYQHEKYSSGKDYCDGEKFYDFDFRGYTDVYEVYNDSSTFLTINMGKRGCTPLRSAAVIDTLRTLESRAANDEDCSDLYEYQNRGGCPLKTDPKKIVERCLTDFDKWDFSDDTFCGRDVLRIEGTLSSLLTVRVIDGHDLEGCPFSIFMDKETGMILKYVEYNTDGSVYDLFVMHEIKFGDEAAPIEKFDPTGKTPFSSAKNLGFHKNSKGETYGSTRELINAENRSILPDYVQIGHFYFNTDEFIAEVGDSINLNDTHQFPEGDEKPIYQLNLYTSEGEFVEVMNYYEGYSRFH